MVTVYYTAQWLWILSEKGILFFSFNNDVIFPQKTNEAMDMYLILSFCFVLFKVDWVSSFAWEKTLRGIERLQFLASPVCSFKYYSFAGFKTQVIIG